MAAESAATPARSSFGEVIDLGETASDLVDVPEANAPPRRGKARVRGPVPSVIATEAEAASEPGTPQVEEAQPEGPPPAEAPRLEEPRIEEPRDEWPSQGAGEEPALAESATTDLAPVAEAEPPVFETLADAQAAPFEPEPAVETEAQPSETIAEGAPSPETRAEDAPARSQEPDAWSQEVETPDAPAEGEALDAPQETARPEPLEPAGAEGDGAEHGPPAPKRQGWWSRN